MFKKRFYFNGNYVIKGFKFFGRIYGTIIKTNYPQLFRLGANTLVDAETFYKITPVQLKTLEEWGYFGTIK